MDSGLEEAAEYSQCPICLGNIEDTAYVAFCLHQFCFTCIKEWARRRARCPLCRKHFNLVLHSLCFPGTGLFPKPNCYPLWGMLSNSVSAVPESPGEN
uniref:RING-type E3 ubiquitin transferase n=1 Tax=Calidris pygmaea TaxID=425635 RepID=A0A8C3K882_9CHAR